MTNAFVSSVIHRAQVELADELNGLGFKVAREHPRADNSYICNDTNWRGLVAVGESQETGGRLKASFFVHIPYASPEHGDHATLARALSVVIGKLVAVSTMAAGH